MTGRANRTEFVGAPTGQERAYASDPVIQDAQMTARTGRSWHRVSI